VNFLLDTDINEIVEHLPLGALSQLAGKHILLTGGRGFLGRYFTAVLHALNERYLGGSPVRVTVLDNFISAGEAGRDLPDLPHVTFRQWDVIKPYPEGDRIDFIMHAAGIASPAHYRAHPLETLEVATTGLRNSLDLAKKNPGCKLVFFSSSEIYGDPTEGNVPTPETYKGHVACLGPRACYDESKRLGETLCQIYAQQFGVHAMIIRPFNVYGPGMQATDYRVLPNFAARIALGEPLEVYGNGKQTRTYCYVADAIGGFLRVLLHGKAGEPYNIGNPSPEISVNVLAGACMNAVGRDVPVEIKPHPASYPADEPNRRCPNISKAQRELGYTPRIALDDGLRRFFSWALEAYSKKKAA
jgi:UDP-glucuronate decarboxylase